MDGEGVAELIEKMKPTLPWQDKPATVIITFKHIKASIPSSISNAST